MKSREEKQKVNKGEDEAADGRYSCANNDGDCRSQQLPRQVVLGIASSSSSSKDPVSRERTKKSELLSNLTMGTAETKCAHPAPLRLSLRALKTSSLNTPNGNCSTRYILITTEIPYLHRTENENVLYASRTQDLEQTSDMVRQLFTENVSELIKFREATIYEQQLYEIVYIVLKLELRVPLIQIVHKTRSDPSPSSSVASRGEDLVDLGEFRARRLHGLLPQRGGRLLLLVVNLALRAALVLELVDEVLVLPPDVVREVSHLGVVPPGLQSHAPQRGGHDLPLHLVVRVGYALEGAKSSDRGLPPRRLLVDHAPYRPPHDARGALEVERAADGIRVHALLAEVLVLRLVAHEGAGDDHLLGPHEYDLLAGEELLGDDGAETAVEVIAAVDEDGLLEDHGAVFVRAFFLCEKIGDGREREGDENGGGLDERTHAMDYHFVTPRRSPRSFSRDDGTEI
ncbi:hypothetical protein ACHAW5_002678 [Stephanodiscus triporus]|uniref:Uncharacterized protein n=1 Tax=Stephanodiscus triporus TaxID=2934178 RepID=A0ABD3NBG6_9STRA